jgi:hypothetical protein
VILHTKKKLTNRQVAVLAAVERLGEPTLPELSAQFAGLSASTVLRVLEALMARELVEWRGDPQWVYLGAAAVGMIDEDAIVRFRAAPRRSNARWRHGLVGAFVLVDYCRGMKFSEYYGITRAADDNWFDPILTADTELYVDPFRLYVENEERWAGAHSDLIDFFDMAMELVAKSGLDTSSARWKKAKRLLTFPEPAEFCLGYGVTPLGAGTGEGYGGVMLDGAATAIAAGIESVSHFEELTLFEEGVGPDRISDIVCNVLKSYFISYTQEVAERHGVALEPIGVRHASWDRDRGMWRDDEEPLPLNPWTRRAVLLVPSRFLRTLPTVEPPEFWDWAWEYRSEDIRGDFNYDIGKHVNARLIVSFARANPRLADDYMGHLEEEGAKPPYDFDADPSSEYQWYDAALGLAARSTVSAQPNEAEEFCDWVRELLEDFAHNIEEQDGWMLLWVDDRPRKERFVQAMLRTFVVRVCKDNDVDLTGEANAGRGPVDFKFSKGWKRRALAEVKLTNSAQYWHGLERQTPQYMKSEGIKCGYFVSVGYRDLDFTEKRMEDVRKAGEVVSKRMGYRIVPLFVDARKKESASKAGRSKGE